MVPAAAPAGATAAIQSSLQSGTSPLQLTSLHSVLSDEYHCSICQAAPVPALRVAASRVPLSLCSASAAVAAVAIARTRSKTLARRRRRSRCMVPLQASTASNVLPKLPRIYLGHDGSAEASRWLELFEMRRLGGDNLELLSPRGQPSSTLPHEFQSLAEKAPLGKIFALIEGGGGHGNGPRVLRSLETEEWALDQPCIGSPAEWESWDYAVALKAQQWGDIYAWEYFRYLRSPSEGRRSDVERRLSDLSRLAGNAGGGSWWQTRDGSSAAAEMLDSEGFCVLDNFLEDSVAQAVQRCAHGAWDGGGMAAGKLSTGDSFARGDSVLWVNMGDPADAAGAAGDKSVVLTPEDGQASAAVRELGPVLESIDAFVANVLATSVSGRYAERMRNVSTRSHAMFTCYPADPSDHAPFSGSSRGYLRHMDNDRLQAASVEQPAGGQDNGRVLTTILYFNPDWLPEHRGAIRLFERDVPLQVRADVLPICNRLIAFWSDEIPHEVLPPARNRFALTFWYLDRTPGPSAVAFDRAPANSMKLPAATVQPVAGSSMFVD